MARREPAGLASDLAPFSLCTSEPAEVPWASPLVRLRSAACTEAGLDQNGRGRTLALARCRTPLSRARRVFAGDTGAGGFAAITNLNKNGRQGRPSITSPVWGDR